MLMETTLITFKAEKNICTVGGGTKLLLLLQYYDLNQTVHAAN